jgi:cysteine desulfurase
MEVCKFLGRRGLEVTYLSVDKYGMVNPDDVKNAITDKTILISVIHANNEMGAVEPIVEIGQIAKEAGVCFHTDAVQTVGHIPVDVNELKVDLLSMSAHKLYGPKGIGALYIRKGTRLLALMHGGKLERR